MSRTPSDAPPVRVLLVEDDTGDAVLITAVLHSGRKPYEVEVVSDQEGFESRVRASGSCDVIVSDYNLRGYSGLEALRFLRAIGSSIPLILVTGTLDDEVAAQSIALGVADYILKDRLARLPDAIQRALEQQRLREEHARLEEGLRQAQKMEAVGQLASGVAHDFNNILNVISGYAEILHDRLPASGKERNMVMEIRTAVQRAATLTHQLLAFGRKQVLQPVVLDPNTACRETEKMLRRVIGEDIALSTHLSPKVARVKIDRGQLEHALLNLALNARDAMPQGGKLGLATGMVELDEAYARSHPEISPGTYVEICVSDSGVGMDETTRLRIFEPFFTTKQIGKGTGLGLATVYGIVKQSGGHINVYSELGHGTEFKLYLPPTDEPAEEPRRVVPGAPVLGNETIMLVEDENQLRTVSKMFLESRGYTVLSASSGEEALQVIERSSSPVHLLITDVVLPGMSGRELAERVLRGPGSRTRALFMSGYTDDAMLRHGLEHGKFPFIRKPFPLHDLSLKVREVLDA